MEQAYEKVTREKVVAFLKSVNVIPEDESNIYLLQEGAYEKDAEGNLEFNFHAPFYTITLDGHFLIPKNLLAD